MRLNRQFVLAAFVAVIFMLVSGVTLACTDSKAPPEAKAQENPVEATDEVLAQAKKVYRKSCKKCHGSKGNGKGPGAKDMDPLPPDWTQGIDFTDGELHWFTMNGCEGTEMKGWKAGAAKPGKEITDEQAWGLVHYMRTFVK